MPEEEIAPTEIIEFLKTTTIDSSGSGMYEMGMVLKLIRDAHGFDELVRFIETREQLTQAEPPMRDQELGRIAFQPIMKVLVL